MGVLHRQDLFIYLYFLFFIVNARGQQTSMGEDIPEDCKVAKWNNCEGFIKALTVFHATMCVF